MCTYCQHPVKDILMRHPTCLPASRDSFRCGFSALRPHTMTRVHLSYESISTHHHNHLSHVNIPCDRLLRSSIPCIRLSRTHHKPHQPPFTAPWNTSCPAASPATSCLFNITITWNEDTCTRRAPQQMERGDQRPHGHTRRPSHRQA